MMPDDKKLDFAQSAAPRIPFLRPNLVRFERYREYLQGIDEHFAGLGAVCTVNNATTGLMLALPETEALSERVLSLPLREEMTRENVASVVDGLAQAEAAAR